MRRYKGRRRGPGRGRGVGEGGGEGYRRRTLGGLKVHAICTDTSSEGPPSPRAQINPGGGIGIQGK